MTGPSHASCPCGSPLPYDTCCGPLLRGERQAMETRVLLLQDGTIERDMLDEQARRALNLTAKDEVTIIRQRQESY